MNGRLESRITALEQSRQRSGVQVVIIRGGLLAADEDPNFGKAGDLRFERTEGETFSGFQSRAVAQAAGAGERLVIFGGLGE
jgi:hypothetical protein